MLSPPGLCACSLVHAVFTPFCCALVTLTSLITTHHRICTTPPWYPICLVPQPTSPLSVPGFPDSSFKVSSRVLKIDSVLLVMNFGGRISDHDSLRRRLLSGFESEGKTRAKGREGGVLLALHLFLQQSNLPLTLSPSLLCPLPRSLSVLPLQKRTKLANGVWVGCFFLPSRSQLSSASNHPRTPVIQEHQQSSKNTRVLFPSH